jgi:long-chain acyl-CoA synthetase
MLFVTAARQPDKVFLTAPGGQVTYAEVEDIVRKAASGLRQLGVTSGDRIGLLMPNSIDFVASYYAGLLLGAVPVPFNVTTPAPELASLLSDCGATLLIAAGQTYEAASQAVEAAPECEHLVVADANGKGAYPDGVVLLHDLIASTGPDVETAATGPDDPAVMLYTSGTTGRPKGVVHSQSSLNFHATFMTNTFWEIASTDVVLIVAPISHIFGQTLLNVSCMAGARAVLMERFDPVEFLTQIQEQKVTFFAGVPTLVYFMLNAPMVGDFDLTSLRRVMIGGDALPPQAMKALAAKFELEVITGYGLTEGVPLTYLSAAMMESSPEGSIGVPASGTQVRIVDEEGRDALPGEPGEIAAKGPSIFTEYFERPEDTAAAFRDGWFHTGDVGRVDEAGHFYIIDRIKDVIKRSGYSVFPAEIERVLLAHPSVANVGVVGIPDDALGEEIKAFVVPAPGQEIDEDTLISHAKENLAAYKYPRIIEIREELPLTPSGKVMRRELRQGL